MPPDFGFSVKSGTDLLALVRLVFATKLNVSVATLAISRVSVRNRHIAIPVVIWLATSLTTQSCLPPLHAAVTARRASTGMSMAMPEV